MFYVLKRKSIIAGLLVVLLTAVIIGAVTVGITASRANVPSMNLTVVIDAGHGGADGGVSSADGVKESDLNLAVAKKLAAYFRGVGAKVIMTRDTPNGLYGLSKKNFKQRDMQAREKIIKESNADLMLSIHMNSFSDTKQRGAQVFYKTSSEASKELAEVMRNQLAKNLESSDRIILPGDYFILNCSDMPAVLIECGFLSNSNDLKILQDADYQEKIAYNIFFSSIVYLERQPNLDTNSQ